MAAAPARDRLSLPVDAIKKAINADPEWSIAARFWNATIRFYTNESDEYFMEIEHGKVVNFQEGSDGYMASTIYVGGPRRAWREVLKTNPKRLCNDFFPAAIHHGMRLGGDLSSLYAYYSAMQRILAVMRQQTNKKKA